MEELASSDDELLREHAAWALERLAARPGAHALDAELFRELSCARGDRACAAPRARARPPRRAARGSRSRATRRRRRAISPSAPPSASLRAPRSIRSGRSPACRAPAPSGRRGAACGSKPSRGSNFSFGSFALRIRSSRNERSPSLVRSHVWTYQFGSAARTCTARRAASTARSRPPSGTRSRRAAARACRGRARDEVVLLGRRRAAPGVRASSNCAERLLELLADARRAGVCASAAIIGPTYSSASRIARASSGVRRGAARNVSPHSSLSTWTEPSCELRVDRVAAAAEVDEVEQREVLLELVGRDRREALEQLRRRDLGVALLAARGEEVGEQRLQDARTARAPRPGGALDCSVAARAPAPRAPVSAALPSCRSRTRRSAVATSRCSSSGSSGTARPSWRSTHEASWGMRRVLGDEDAVLEPARRAVRAPHPPGRVAAHLDPRLADDVADLPRRPAAVQLDVEVGGRAEVALAPRRELDVAADARDAERADVVAVEVVPDDVPDAVVGHQRVRVERPLALLVARDRPVLELHRPLLRDRALELRQPPRHLGGVVGIEHLDAPRGLASAPR